MSSASDDTRRARDWSDRIDDILDAIARIQRYTAGLDEATFARTDMAVDAVIRNIAMIGEAARHAPPDVVAANPEIPWRQMQQMRNILIHDYATVDLAIVWDTIRNDLPRLADALPATRRLGRQPPS